MKEAFHKTLEELDGCLTKNNIEWLLTRLLSDEKKISDLDILVRKTDFQTAIKVLEKAGYKKFSHDHALGGRKKGYQINLVKKDRIKIDLHKDFTWRKSKYIDTSLVWRSKQQSKAGKVVFHKPSYKVDAFLVYINILFEKTYISNKDEKIFEYREVLCNEKFNAQARKYNWGKSLTYLRNWLEKKEKFRSPEFLPFWLICFSYWEKLKREKSIDIVSFLYYLFFRVRYCVNSRLPYE